MAKNDNLSDYLLDIANAIREKKGTSEPINAQDFSSEIATIEGGGGGTPATDMPVIGDGKTYLYIKIAEKGRMDVPLYLSVVNGVTIDWGDGSTPHTLRGTGNADITHTYADKGEYVISLNPADGCTLGLGHNSDHYCVMGRIGNNAKVYCNMLQAVEIGKNVTSIDYNAFYNCYSLTSLVIPAGVTSIGEQAFYFCYSLKSVVIPDGVTNIGNDAFAYDGSLASVVIPKSVTSIGDGAFFGCHSLASVIIPEGVTKIGNDAFNQCHSLASVIIPEGVTIIGYQAFYQCYSLASVVIPNSITEIDGRAFGSCYGMAFYDFSQCTSVPTLGNTDAFTSIPSGCKIIVPDELHDTWVAATNWSSYASKIVKASEFNG